MKTPLIVCAVLAFSVSAYGQAMVGYGLNTGRAGVAGAAANKAGKATAGTFDKAAQTLNKAGANASANAAKPSVAQAPAAAPAKPPETEKPASAPVDVAALTTGMEREELLQKFGKPSMKLTNGDGPDVVEKYFYKSADGNKVVVTLRNGKVVAVSPPAN